MVRVILVEKKQTYLKHKNFQRMAIGEEILDEQNELSDDVIQAFEDKVARDKAEKKKKAATPKKRVVASDVEGELKYTKKKPAKKVAAKKKKTAVKKTKKK
jgi:hypothetical protein